MFIFTEGDVYGNGLTVGRHAKHLIRQNIENFTMFYTSRGVSRTFLLNKVDEVMRDGSIPEETLLYLEGMAENASIRLDDLIAYNLFKNLFLPEECTVLIAMRDSTKDGNVLMLKNSDKIGSEKLVGDKYYNYKEINVVIAEKPENGYTFIAVAAAGEISIKMGLNEKGVATGSNIARTWELKQRKVDLTGLRALDRGWLMREGISKNSTAINAAATALNYLVANPMSTPGNIEFVDGEEAVIVEGSYDRLAVQKTRAGVLARSNRFVVLESLNDPEDVSSYVRYVRAMELLNKNKGQITEDMMIMFSQDHENGPGPNSICRHSNDFREETSLSAAVMEIDVRDTSNSTIHVCLGKPCHAWKGRDGHIKLNFKNIESIPQDFHEGTVFKKYYNEKPSES
jgi:hypothetical protein